jgi:hypothetical protein
MPNMLPRMHRRGNRLEILPGILANAATYVRYRTDIGMARMQL